MNHKISYLAGYIDGDGCFVVSKGIQNKKTIVYYYSIEICSVYKEIIEYFYREYGGSFWKRPEKRTDRKDLYVWSIKTKQSLVIARQVCKHLISKKQICKFFKTLAESIKPNKGIKLSEKVIKKRDKLINKIREQIHMSDNITEENFKDLQRIKQHIDPSEKELAYFAGLSDAEGCFRIQHWKDKRKGRNDNFVISFEIGNRKYSIIHWLLSRFGGSVHYRKPTKKTFSPFAIWSLRSAQLEKILEKMYPYLIVKKERCKKIIEFNKIKISHHLNRRSPEFKIYSDKIASQRQLLLEEFKVLNAKGKHI